MKKYSEMTPEEQWRHLHSKRNINGHIRLDTKEAEKALCHARGIALCNDLKTRGGDILQEMETIRSMVNRPEQLPMYFQAMEWMLSQFVKEASELLADASALQEYLHGAREGNKTLVKLIEEREKGYNETR